MEVESNEYVADTIEAVELKLIRSVEDIENDSVSFSPAMTHQVFGPSELLIGYKNLSVKLYYTAGRLTTYLSVTYEDKKAIDGIEPDDVESALAPFLQRGYFTNLDLFCQQITKDESFHPFGEMTDSFSLPDSSSYEVYYAETNNSQFIDFHERMQTFILWFVDGANFVPVDDERWRFFTLFEVYKTSSGDPRYAFAGYVSVYEHYAYPEHIRPRISQVMVLPPFQCRGLCSKMLMSIYNHYMAITNVKDITVEDPSDVFQRVRDFVDCSRCLKLPSFSKENLLKGYSLSMVQDAASKLKMARKQIRRVYEILLLNETDINNAQELDRVCDVIHRRLMLPFQNRSSRALRMKQPVDPLAELNDPKKKKAIVDQIIADYEVVVNRLRLRPLD